MSVKTYVEWLAVKGENQRLREALSMAQGEAYLGTLDGDDTPDPLAACHNVIKVCLDALGGDKITRNSVASARVASDEGER